MHYQSDHNTKNVCHTQNNVWKSLREIQIHSQNTDGLMYFINNELLNFYDYFLKCISDVASKR